MNIKWVNSSEDLEQYLAHKKHNKHYIAMVVDLIHRWGIEGDPDPIQEIQSNNI